MVIDYQFPQFSKIRSNLSLIVYPIQRIVDFPISIFSNLSDYIVSQKAVVAENQYLQQQQLYLSGKLQKLAALESENENLRSLLQSSEKLSEKMLVATIMNVDPDPFTHQVILNKGSKNSVLTGQTVVDSDGIMGTVISTNTVSSRVMLITDASHAIPVENIRNGVRAIAIGTGVSNRLELQHVPNTADIQVGDIMTTSGLGGKFPIGYPVGKVKEVRHESGQPFASIILVPKAGLESSRQVLLIQESKKEKT